MARANNDERANEVSSQTRTRQPVSASKLSLLDELRQAEIRASSAQVASVIGHMIGTPLNVIVGRAALLRASSDPANMVDNARRIEEQAQRLTQRVQGLIDYLTVPEPEHEVRSAREVVEDAVALYAPIAQERGVVLKVPEHNTLDTKVDGTPTLMMLGSLLSLAIRKGEPADPIELDVSEAAEGTGVLFTIRVTGVQLPESRIDRLEPPETYEPRNVETQQLLSVCAAIARRNGGSLKLEAGSGPERLTILLHCNEAEDRIR